MTNTGKRYRRSHGVMDRLKLVVSTPDVPTGIKLNELEQRIWEQFTKIRTNDQWREADLIVLARAVKLEQKIREIDMQLELEGYTLENARGTPVINPLVTVLNTFVLQQGRLLKMVGAMNRGLSPAEQQKAQREALESEKMKTELHPVDNTLLPMPKRG